MKSLLLILCVLVVAACGGDDATETDSDAPTATTATTVATTTTTTAGADAGPLAIVGTYDGEDCRFAGPDTASIDDEFSVTLVNDSADAAFLRVLLIPPDRLADIEPLVGIDFDFSGGRTTSLNPTIYGEADPFSESSSRAFLPSPGKYLVECALVEGATPVHVWWLATLEVNP